MEFLRVVGARRSVRWFRPWRPVEPGRIQRILEVARLTSCPGNAQPWRAVVVEQSALAPEDRARLLAANNAQTPQTLAPVWIYWFGDPDAVTPDGFASRVAEMLPTGALAPQLGWTEENVMGALLDGRSTPLGLPPLDQTVHGLPYEISAIVAAQETNGVCQVAQLAAVAEGLSTCLLGIATPGAVPDVLDVLGVPSRFVPVWLQLVGESAESPDAGGQRPRAPFGELFARGRWGSPFPRDAAVVDDLREEGLVQPAAPLPGRFEELEHLARMFDVG